MSVVVFGGTVEGRKIAEIFSENGVLTEVHLCVATEYGASLLPKGEQIRVHAGRMGEREMEEFLDSVRPDYCIDATHPYAEAVTEHIRDACRSLRLNYLRVIRQEEETADWGDAVYFEQIEDAVSFLAEKEGKILIATGSRDLEKYTRIPDYRNRCTARVLPICSVMEKCKSLGFEGKNLVGMQGPFSEEMNYAILKQINASWLVTKSSGTEGGYQEKYRAAKRAGAGLVVIGRPGNGEQGGKTLREALCFLKERYKIPEKRMVFLIGMGPGDPTLLTEEAKQCIKKCEILLGSKRMLETCKIYQKNTCKTVECWKREEILAFIKMHREYERIGIVYSGDIGFYSGAKGMLQDLSEYEVHPVSGISSVDYLLNQMGISREDVFFTSCHGRSEFLIPLIDSHRRVCVLAQKDTAESLCGELLEFQMDEVMITVGEWLSYEKERIVSGRPEELRFREWETLSVLLIENPRFREKKLGFGMNDRAFLRGQVPMTKEEVRILSLSKLGLHKDSILYDIGAGTGSVSIEAAEQCELGCVYAIEKKKEAVSLIRENQIRFRAQNLILIEGTAPDCLTGLQAPTHVFIGGSGGNMSKIMDAVREKNKEARFVLNAVTLETLTEVWKLKEQFLEYGNMEVVQIQVSKSRELGSYHLMSAENPVFIISFGGRGKDQNER